MLKNRILREIGALARCIHALSDSRFREFGLQRGQFIFLTRVCEQPGINLVELSDLLKVDKTTTTKVVQKLMRENYVRRVRDETDRRMWRLFPTDVARKIYPAVIAEENRNIDACFAGFSADEKTAAYDLCRRMRENIEHAARRPEEAAEKEETGRVVIAEYSAPYKEQVIAMILNIQQNEFGVPITRADQPDLENIPAFYQQGAGNFWLACADGQVVGTVALVDIGGGQAALRKMFVQAAYRGEARSVAARLLDRLLEWAADRAVREVYLGTTAKFLAAHRFYEKHGFAEITAGELPDAFPVMKVDSKFYRRRL